MHPIPKLIDTHTHFDFTEFDQDRIQQARLATKQGIEHLIMAGYVERHFARLLDTQQQLNQHTQLQTHVALGLHPAFISEHSEQHLSSLEQYIRKHSLIALGEIGLDTFDKQMKQADNFAFQSYLFIEQLNLAVDYQLPVLLHIRKSHAEALKILKQHRYNAHRLGGIAHSFSGGEQEGKAFVKLGFKLGITGQICNPNAKKLRRTICAVVAEFGLESIVIETDCPDMPPLPYQRQLLEQTSELPTAKPQTLNTPVTDQPIIHKNIRNNPANLIYILHELSKLLNVDCDRLAQQLWYNSHLALKINNHGR